MTCYAKDTLGQSVAAEFWFACHNLYPPRRDRQPRQLEDLATMFLMLMGAEREAFRDEVCVLGVFDYLGLLVPDE